MSFFVDTRFSSCSSLVSAEADRPAVPRSRPEEEAEEDGTVPLFGCLFDCLLSSFSNERLPEDDDSSSIL